jgi:hypothetical protein
MVDKLIQNTKGNMTLEQSYKTELLKRMENTTCSNNRNQNIETRLSAV